MRGSEHLAEALVLTKVVGPVPAVVDSGKDQWAAVGKSEFVAHKGRYSLRVCDIPPVKEVAGIKCRVAHKFKYRSMNLVGAGFGDDVGEPGGAVADLCRHHAGTRLDLLNRVHIEVRESRSAHLRVRSVDAVRGKNRGRAALAVHGKLLGEIGGAIGVGHGAGGKQEELTEVALVKRKIGHRLAGQGLSTGRLFCRLVSKTGGDNLDAMCAELELIAEGLAGTDLQGSRRQ